MQVGQTPVTASHGEGRVAWASDRIGTASRWQAWSKRCFDVIVALLLLPALVPILGIISLLVLLDSEGPVFFLDRRLGRNGRHFTCYKFRTMHLSSDRILKEHLAKNAVARYEWQQYRKLRGEDPRVTPAGRILRKLSLDELPQIVNVVLGDMSLIGPRPYLVAERDIMGSHRAMILAVRPGITGLWQVSGRNHIAFEHRVQMEAWYSDNWSLWLDAVILVRTVMVVLSRRGAF